MLCRVRSPNAPGEHPMKMSVLLISVTLLVLPVMAFGQEFYRWVDEKGTINFTDDPTLIPEKYRSQAQPKKPPQQSPASPAIPASERSNPVGPQEQADSAPKKTDMLGRGEEWWRAKVKEWNDKLAETQRSYEAAQAAMRGKAKELEDSKFKPDSFQRKLKAEKNSLEEKVKQWEKQVEDVKNMLEKTLPKEAQDYGADPAWLKHKE